MPKATEQRRSQRFIATPFQHLRNLSIRSKLLFLGATSVAFALVLAFAGLATNDIRFIRKSKVEQLVSQSKMLAFNCTGVLTFQDKVATRELLSSMAMYPTVEYACVYDDTGSIFAEYRADGDPSPITPSLVTAGHSITRTGIEVYEPVVDGGEQIGAIYVRTNMSDLRAHVRRYLIIATTIMLGSLLGAGLLSLLLQRSISQPVRQLAEAAYVVKNQQNYSVRVRPNSQDELGQLSVAFNKMLDEIQASKAALQEAHDELEARVVQRTAQLTREIEQRQSIQEALEIARDEAEAASRAKSEFLANMSHEIRTPLNGILGFTELLTNGTDSISAETRTEYLETISSSGQHLLELINDILDLSKIEAGQLEVDLCSCSPHEVINQVVSVLRARAQQKGLNLRCFWSSKVPESILTDGGRLRQLLMNLVGNAIKFTQEGAVTIDAELDHFRELLTIRVVDTGIGIEEDKQQDIFNPFVQADNSVTRRFGGTGLGLAICQKLSSALGGDLRCESKKGQGSSFIVRVKTGPLRGVQLLSAPAADAFYEATQDEPGETGIQFSDARVLLVEDGVVNRKLVKIMLQEAGAEVSTAENGWVAVQLAQRNSFDLIIMDMQMPVMDGYTATTKLRELGVTTPILALTAHAMKGDEEKCLNAGCTAYLTKPIRKDALMDSIRDHLSAAMDGSDEGSKDSENELPNGGQFLSTLPLDNPVYQEIVVEFVEFLDEHIKDMQAAFMEGDFETIARLAHALKGAGGTAGFDVLTAPAADLHQAAKKSNSAQAEQMLRSLSEISERISATPQCV